MIVTNIDVKLDYYAQEQTYKHMLVLNSKKQADLCHYLGLMV